MTSAADLTRPSSDPTRQAMAATNSNLWKVMHDKGDLRGVTIQKAGNVERSAEELGQTLEALKRRNAERRAQEADRCCPIL